MAQDIDGLIAKRFIQRRDVKAAQFQNGHYEPVNEPWKMRDIRDHLAGDKTYGHYLVDHDGNCRLFAFDVDLTKTGWWTCPNGVEEQINPREVWLNASHPARDELVTQLRCMAEGLAIRTKRLLGIPVAVAYSGSKGLHVYGWTGEMSAGHIREAALELLNSWGCFEPSKGNNFFKHRDGLYPNLEIEVFPKQSEINKEGFGNLMRLPLGINRKTGQQGFLLNLATPHTVIVPGDPLPILANGAEW